MESFFLAETTKYLYLLFDPDHFLNNNGGVGTIINTPNGDCIIDAGGYIFNTEAHPIDLSALRCCHENFRSENLLGSYDDFLSYKKRKAEPKKNEIGASSLIDPKVLSLNLDKNKNEWLEFFNLINSTLHNEIKKLILENDTSSLADEVSLLNPDPDALNASEENEIKIKSIEHPLNASKDKEQVNRSEFTERIKNYEDFPEKPVQEEKQPFDEQRMIERIRKLNNLNEDESEKDYELLTCKAQSYSQRLAVFGEILT